MFPLRKISSCLLPFALSAVVACGDDATPPIDIGTLQKKVEDLDVSARIIGMIAGPFAFSPNGTAWVVSGDTTISAQSYAFEYAAATATAGAIKGNATPSNGAFPGFYLAQRGLNLAFGVTYADFSGTLYLYSDSLDTTNEVAAPGNFDVDYFDSDTVLVDGTGLGSLTDGQGVYAYTIASGAAAKVVTDLGDASGYLAVGSDVVFVGGAFGANFENRIYAIARTKLAAAISSGTPISAENDATLVYQGDISDAAAAGNDLFILDSSFNLTTSMLEFNAVRRVKTTVSGDTVTAMPSEVVFDTAGADTITGLAGVSISAVDEIGMRMNNGDVLLVRVRSQQASF